MNYYQIDITVWRMKFERHFYEILKNPDIDENTWEAAVKLQVIINKYLNQLYYIENDTK